MECLDETDDIVEFALLTTEKEISTVDSFDWFIGWYLDDLE